MATQPRSLSYLMANHLRLLPETAIFLSISVRLFLFGPKLPFIVKLLLLFLTGFLKYLPVNFSGWLARSKHLLIYFYYIFCLFLLSLWLPNQFNGGLNRLHLYLVLEVVIVSLLTCIVRWSSSDSLVERNIYSQFVQYIFNEDNQLSDLTSDLQRLEVAEVDGEPVSGCETPIIESDKPFVPNRELSNDTAQTEDLSGLQGDLLTETFKKLSVSRSYELKRDCSLLTSDLKRLEKRGRILVAEVDGEPVSRYETPIIESDKPFVPNRELSNDTTQTEDLSGLQGDLLTETFKKLSVSRSYELKRDCSHLTSDLQILGKRRRILDAEVDGEPVSGYETPIIESDKPFVLNRELSNDTAQTEDLFGLPGDLLTEIFKKLSAFHDFAFCSTVCKLWWLNMKWSFYPPHPWSIHFQGQNIMNHLDDGRYVLERWEIDGRYYYGCVNGWILSIGSEHISIFNLFSRTQRNLPMLSPFSYMPITEPSDWYSNVQKFILFKIGQGDYFQVLAVALFGPRGFIAFTGPQFQDWIYIQSDDMAPFRDVVLFGEQFYALCGRGKLVLCAFDRSNPCVSLVSREPAGSFRADRYYLVKNLDHLIAVFQYGNVDSGGKRFATVNFGIYRSDDIMDWTRIREPIYLEGRALFISNGNSWMIDPVTFENCRTNSIYFTDEYWFTKNGDGHFTGLFDIAERNFEDFLFDMDQYPPNDSSPFSLTYNDGA